MRFKIIRNILFKIMCAVLILESIIYFISQYIVNPSSVKSLAEFYNQPESAPYISIMILVLVLAVVCFFLMFRKCNRAYRSTVYRCGISDSELYACYQAADKCDKFRVYSHLAFIHTLSGIICLNSSDIIKGRMDVCGVCSITNNSKFGLPTGKYDIYLFELVTNFGTFSKMLYHPKKVKALQSCFNF